MSRALRLGTRSSPLARWQTRTVADALRRAAPDISCAEILLSTAGDRDRATPLPEIGGKGLFTEALEAALLAGEIDVAVHSLKDLPTAGRDGLVVAAVCVRGDPRDVLIAVPAATLATLPPGARVGTSSTRRTAQLRALRPDLAPAPIRGNVDTRVRKVQAGEYDAVLLAAAGIERLGLAHVVSEYLPLDRMLPAPGQGALAVQCRAEDGGTRDLLASVDDPDTRAAVTAERAFLAALGGGCSAPVAAYARTAPDGSLDLRGLVVSPDGSPVVRVEGRGARTDAEGLGSRLAADALAGGAAVLLS